MEASISPLAVCECTFFILFRLEVFFFLIRATTMTTSVLLCVFFFVSMRVRWSIEAFCGFMCESENGKKTAEQKQQQIKQLEILLLIRYI